MTLLYRIYKTIVPIICRTYFSKIEIEGSEHVTGKDPVLFVANHPSALLDPMVCGAFAKIPINYLGRADLFKSKIASWFLTSSHMWPIYRDVDGRENLDKNEEVFKHCYAKLKMNQALLLYGEGFTDEKFVRRVKKIKKGPARIAFGAEEHYHFEMGLKIIPLGINYSNPDEFGSDILLKYGEPILVSDFKEKYQENQAKAMLELTNLIEKRLKECIIHIEDAKSLKLFENAEKYRETFYGLSSNNYVKDLKRSWKETKKDSEKFNQLEEGQKEQLTIALSEVSTFNVQKISGIESKHIDNVLSWIWLIFMAPFSLAGYLLNFPIFLLLKVLPAKLTRRSCFYPGMKIAFSMILFPLVLSIEFFILKMVFDVPLYYWPVYIVGVTILGYSFVKSRLYLNRISYNRKVKKLKQSIHEPRKKEYQSILERINMILN
jgi:glycerol-3-phosphate O-acyltransferase/dihydroxyacetone phosphate acyltransferase